MTPQEKARVLAEAVNYCRANNLLTTQELQTLQSQDKEARFKVMCTAVARMQRLTCKLWGDINKDLI